jgi:hypothetical protein
MRILIAITLAVACGIGLGFGTAELRIRQYPWKGGVGADDSVRGGQLNVNEDEYNFGKMYSHEDGKHEFTVTNQGVQPLTLAHGSTSCSCTVSNILDNELAPGQSTKVVVTWRSKGRIGAFRQSVTIMTSDPSRPGVTFTITGEYTQAVYADPDELTFGHIAGTKAITREARILCNLPESPLKIERFQLSDPTLEKFFGVNISPLEEGDLRKQKPAVSGALVRVTVKPGLPLGPFQQRILLETNLKQASEVDLPLFGTVGEVTLVGPGWSSESGILEIGTLESGKATQRRLIILSRGPDAKEMKFKIASATPDFVKVRLGKTIVGEGGRPSQTELFVEIPEQRSPANYMGEDGGKTGEIVLETTNPPIHSLRIRVRFALLGSH